MIWLCTGSICVVVDGISKKVIEAESLIGQHCFVYSTQRKAVISCQQACEYLEITGEGLVQEAKQMQEYQLQKQQQLEQETLKQQRKSLVDNLHPPLLSSTIYRIKKLLRNGIAVSAFKQNPLSQDKRVLDGSEPVWHTNMASLSSDGVLSMEDTDDSSDAVTISVAQALVMTGAASHPLLARRASFCLAVSSSVAYFISCSDEMQRSEWLLALAAAGAIIENPDMLTGGSHVDALAHAALQEPDVPAVRISGSKTNSHSDTGIKSNNSVLEHAISDVVVPPTHTLSTNKPEGLFPAPKSPSVNTPTPAPVLAPAQAPLPPPLRSSPLSDSLPPPSPISTNLSSHETFALQVNLYFSFFSAVHALALISPLPFPPSILSAVYHLLYPSKRFLALCRT
jgi:hypothetical protein